MPTGREAFTRGRGVPGRALAIAGLALAGLACVWLAPTGGASGPSPDRRLERSGHTLEALLDRAYRRGWDTLAIGERVARFGLALRGAPYLDATLEGPGPEVCRVTTRGFDCVTFMELCLDLGRVAASRGDSGARATPEDVREAVTFTRYRGGRLTDYTSRLHYTGEWIADNVAKGVIEDVTASLGGEPCLARVGYMSAHPDRYPALAANPAFVDSMRRIESAIHRVPRACIPRERVAAIEPRLRSGDLIAIATSIDGLDYAHTGMIVRDERGVARFLHASSKQGRVILDRSLSDYLAGGPKSHTGVTVVRPLEVAPGLPVNASGRRPKR